MKEFEKKGGPPRESEGVKGLSKFLPMTESILRLIHDGRIGAVRYVNANFGFAAPANPEGREAAIEGYLGYTLYSELPRNIREVIRFWRRPRGVEVVEPDSSFIH